MKGKKEIRRQINSTRSIARITRAMQMVAAAKMKKAQREALEGRPFANEVLKIISRLQGQSELGRSIWSLEPPAPLKDGLGIILTTDRGLCGNLNHQLFSYLQQELEKKPQSTWDWILVGEKGLAFLSHLRGELIAKFHWQQGIENIFTPLNALITQKFLAGTYRGIWLIFNRFISAFQQKPTLRRLLPLRSWQELPQEIKTSAPTPEQGREYLLEPFSNELLDQILFLYLEVKVREALYEAEASEHSARMMAMKNATDNAEDLIYHLRLDYNKHRQTEITSELLDAVRAKSALEENAN